MVVAGAPTVARMDGMQAGGPCLETLRDAIVAEAKRAGRADGGTWSLRTGGETGASLWCK